MRRTAVRLSPSWRDRVVTRARQMYIESQGYVWYQGREAKIVMAERGVEKSSRQSSRSLVRRQRAQAGSRCCNERQGRETIPLGVQIGNASGLSSICVLVSRKCATRSRLENRRRHARGRQWHGAVRV